MLSVVSLTIALAKTMQLAEMAWNTRKSKNCAVLVTKTVAIVDKQKIISDQSIKGLRPN